MEETKQHYDFVEVMTCPGGCIGGGGQPKHIGEDMQEIRKNRIASLYDKDAAMTLRNSHDNPHIKAVYEEFYGTPLSERAEKLLHTSYQTRNDLGEDATKYAMDFQKMTETPKESSTSSDIKYRCTICGYIYEGDITKESDEYKCPICTVPKEMFEIINEPKDEPEESSTSSDVKYRCTICGYIYEGDITKESDEYKCPICTVPKEMFEKIA